ncbi:hypothetical protein [Streptomyces sp. NPDC090798]|uniref:hypothetical protein n=1 Tax=Streptomyces sp. NPDC090798 TaxID=3365968 RepID=UPI0037F96CD0
MGVKLPRIECQACRRHIAAGPVAGRLGKGRVWRHDPPGRGPGVLRRLLDEPDTDPAVGPGRDPHGLDTMPLV